MKQTTKEIIMYDAPDTATFKNNISGWVSKSGRFWGKDEHMARWEACTHLMCDCGKPMSKNYTKCDSCRHRLSNERYNNLPLKEWDGVTPLVLYNDDQYFFDSESIDEYCEENNEDVTKLRFVICEPNYYSRITPDIWADDLAEDFDIPDELYAKINELNKFIGTLPVASWKMGKFRTTLPATP